MHIWLCVCIYGTCRNTDTAICAHSDILLQRYNDAEMRTHLHAEIQRHTHIYIYIYVYTDIEV